MLQVVGDFDNCRRQHLGLLLYATLELECGIKVWTSMLTQHIGVSSRPQGGLVCGKNGEG